jgi:integrase
MAGGKVASTSNGSLRKRLNSRNLDSSGRDPAARSPKQPITCPECGSLKIVKDGLRYPRGNKGPSIQRYLCKFCGFRFSEPHRDSNPASHREKPSQEKMFSAYLRPNISDYKAKRSILSCQVGGLLTEGLKNLAESETQQKQHKLESIHKNQATTKGKIVEYCFYMQKNGYAESTIRLNRTALKVLAARGANLLDPESVKEVISKQKGWSENRKRNVINAYSLFLEMEGLTWKKPKCKVTQKIPFIPTQEEIDALIAGSGKKTATFLQLQKETAMRCGEAKRLEWINLDFEKNLITLNAPEKGSSPRMWKVSQKLMGMLDALPRKSQKIFGEGPINSLKTTFLKTRKRLAAKLQNPRLLRISFHTLRHWKATALYHQTKDPYYVKQFLGHKSLKSTEIYITVEHAMFEPGNNEFTVKIAEKPERVKALLEVGFEYVCQKDGLVYLRKRK